MGHDLGPVLFHKSSVCRIVSVFGKYLVKVSSRLRQKGSRRRLSLRSRSQFPTARLSDSNPCGGRIVPAGKWSTIRQDPLDGASVASAH